jgi:hypothetical protein
MECDLGAAFAIASRLPKSLTVLDLCLFPRINRV